jgi:NAD+ synthase
MKHPHNTYTRIVSEIEKYFKENGFKQAVLGVSGGIDSALTLKLLTDALQAENVTGLIMPEHGVTKDENILHAKRLCDFLGAKKFTIPINKYLLDLLQLPWKPSDLAQMNVKARLRAIILYNYANTNNALVVGSSNKSELLLGYGTKFGDLAADILPLGDLYKTDVYALAEHIGLPKEIIEKAPTAELKKGQTDEQDLGAKYEELDKVLQELETRKAAEASQQNQLELDAPIGEFAKEIMKRMQKNEHKLTTPYIIQL